MTTTTLPRTLALGGDLTIDRLGLGAMRLAAGADHATAVGTARYAVELGVDLFDTADAYDLGDNETLLAEALHPYDGVVVATKAGRCHPGDDWIDCGRPEYLRQQAELSLKRLRVERLDVLQLHRIDATVPLADQVGALRRLQDEGKVRHVGLSEVSVAQLDAARAITPIACVQNRYGHADRRSEDVLAACERYGIAFLAYLPVAAAARGAEDGALASVAARYGVTRVQVALAWLLHHSPVLVPIPGTSSRTHLAENVAARGVRLDDDDLAALERTG